MDGQLQRAARLALAPNLIRMARGLAWRPAAAPARNEKGVVDVGRKGIRAATSRMDGVLRFFSYLGV